MIRRLLAILVLLALAVTGYAYTEAISTPRIRTAHVRMSGWPAGAPPVRMLLMSDIHVAGSDMPPERLVRIVAQANALHPDVVLIAGDFVSQKLTSTRVYTMADAIAPLAGLRARTITVLGNHDYWTDAPGARAALAKAGVKLLENAAAVAGPFVIGGLGDDFTRHADLPRTLAAMRALPGVPILLSHSPDPFVELTGGPTLMLAGHTHCGQIAPWPIGPIITMSRYGRRYACGIVRERGRTLVVSAGLGTSGLPLRIGAPPDMWLLTLGRR